jgi:DNA-binding NarL/FixJ family response regulator
MKAVLAGERSATREAVGRALTRVGWTGPTVDEVVALPDHVHTAPGSIVVVSDRWPRARRWLEASAELTVPAVVVDPDRKHDASLQAAGARGLLGWPMSTARLEAALRAVEAGFEVRDPGPARPDVDFEIRGMTPGSAQPAFGGSSRLSPREREILAQVAAGASNKRIAAACGVSPNTVKFHLAHLFAKLGVTTRAEAVATAIARGELAI